MDSFDATITLTSLPARLPGIIPTLESLFAQSVKPRRIVLAISEVSAREQRPYELTEELRKLVDEGKIEVIESPVDWGPATKFYALAKELIAAGEPDHPMIIVDDDAIYGNHLIRSFAEAAGQYPDAALCIRGGPTLDRLGRFVVHPASYPIDEGPNAEADPAALPIDIMTGCSSYLLRPRFLEPDFEDFSALPKEAYLMDDDHLSGYLAERGIPRLLIPFCGYEFDTPDEGYIQDNALQDGTLTIDGWDLYRRLPVILHYRKHWRGIDWKACYGPVRRLKYLGYKVQRLLGRKPFFNPALYP